MIQSKPTYKHVACCICQSRTNRAHRLPALATNEDKLHRFAEWVNFAAIENVYKKLKYYWICEIHFEDNAFCNRLKLKLLRTAVPTLNPPIYEGPPTEDGSPSSPVVPKEETLKKIYNELIAWQDRKGPVKQRRKFYNFITSSPDEMGSVVMLKDKKNCLKTDLQDRIRKFSEQNSGQAAICQSKDGRNSNAEVSSQNETFKTPSNSPVKSNCVEKDNNIGSSGSIGPSFCSQKIRPLILKKIPASFKSHSANIHCSSVEISSSTLTGADSSVQLLSDLDNSSVNCRSTSTPLLTAEKISTINNQKQVDAPSENSNLSEKPDTNNVMHKTIDPMEVEGLNLSSHGESMCEITHPIHSVVELTSNEKDEQYDILSTAINNSDILFSDLSYAGEEVVGDNKEIEYKENQDAKYVKKQSVTKKKYYDPVLIDSVLNKMKLKKNGPVCVVTLEKKPDRLFKGFTKNKLVTLYKQQIKKNWKNKKMSQGMNKNSTDATKKARKKRRCTCSIHCQRRSNSSKTSSSPVVNVSSGVGIKFEGTTSRPNIMNIDSDLADEELFNVENVFNVSTILTNVHDRSQIEQLCQMLVESIFRLKSLNIEGTMAKLQVYIAQMPESGVNKLFSDNKSAQTSETEESSKSNNTSHNIEVVSHNVPDVSCDQEVILSSFHENDSEQIPSFITLTDDKEMHLCNEVPVTAERPHQSVGDSNLDNQQPKPKNVKVRLSTFHDHSYVKQESNYIFEKPEYLVKLINIGTYRCPRKVAKPPLSGISKKEVERHTKACQKLSNRIMHLRELIKKKNKNIKSMHKKIKYLGGIVCQEKGIKRVKYPKVAENSKEKQIDSVKTIISPQDHLQIIRKDEAKILIDVSVDQMRIDNVASISSLDSACFFQDSPQGKVKKAHGNKMKKNTSLESFDVLYENLIEELCCNEMEY